MQQNSHIILILTDTKILYPLSLTPYWNTSTACHRLSKSCSVRTCITTMLLNIILGVYIAHCQALLCYGIYGAQDTENQQYLKLYTISQVTNSYVNTAVVGCTFRGYFSTRAYIFTESRLSSYLTCTVQTLRSTVNYRGVSRTLIQHF